MEMAKDQEIRERLWQGYQGEAIMQVVATVEIARDESLINSRRTHMVSNLMQAIITDIKKELHKSRKEKMKWSTDGTKQANHS